MSFLATLSIIGFLFGGGPTICPDPENACGSGNPGGNGSVHSGQKTGSGDHGDKGGDQGYN